MDNSDLMPTHGGGNWSHRGGKTFFPFWGWGRGGLTVDSTLSNSSVFWKKKCGREQKPPNLLSSAISDPNPVTLMEGK